MSSLAYSGLGLNYTYGYDTLGNITSVVKNGSTEATYAYDLQNQLVSETVGGNTYAYNYDTVGNLMSVQKNGSTIKSYTYGDSAWADLLTAFTVNGVTGSITYDNVGNPLTYYNGTSYAMTWTPERRLATLTGGGKTVSYAYDMDGIRTSKTVNGTTTSYTTVSGQVVRETTGSSVIDFAYEDTGAPYAMRYNGSIYYYLLNLQGDVVGLVDASGNTVASYTYDAWGNVLSATGTLAAINPIRYRGYYYDSETGLYYVSSRYYDPEIGRWINADSVIAGTCENILGYNMFAYCFNNPVNMTDNSGHWPQWIKDAVDWVNDKVIQPVVSFVKDIVEDVNNFELNNESEEKVLESNYFSSYKGVPVIRTNRDRSGSFGAIFLTRETNNRSNPEYIIRHEYGHTKQLEQLGIVNYVLCIGLPSWQRWGTGEYYSKPWEITADIYGGVQSENHSQSNIDRGFAYLEGSKIIGPLIWVFIE